MSRATEWREATETPERADTASGTRLARDAGTATTGMEMPYVSRSWHGRAETGPITRQICRFQLVPPVPCIQVRGRSRFVLALVAMLVAMLFAACAPQRPAPGALAPVTARRTNESRQYDFAVIDAIEARRLSLLRNDGPDLPARSVALARAGAWLAFAREAYLLHPQTNEADDALAEASTLMAPYTREIDAPGPRSALAVAADRLSPDNWAEVGRLVSKPEVVADAASLAEAEIELVRATALPLAPPTSSVVLAGASHDSIASAVVLPSVVSQTSVSPLACATGRHIARAMALLVEADMVQQGAAREHAAITALQTDDRVRQRQLHFAVKSDVVGMPSAALLNGVAGALKAHPELSLVIEGYADPRGTDDDNRMLSGRRATTVRDILADSGVTDERMLVRQFGKRNRAATGTTAVDYARDRRVRLKFVLPTGEELPIADEESVDLQIERVLKRHTPTRRPGAKPTVRKLR